MASPGLYLEEHVAGGRGRRVAVGRGPRLVGRPLGGAGGRGARPGTTCTHGKHKGQLKGAAAPRPTPRAVTTKQRGLLNEKHEKLGHKRANIN